MAAGMDRTSEEQFGTAPIVPLMLRMALPGVVAQLVNLLYSIIDRIFIGHIEGVGLEALAGVGVCASIEILVSAFSQIVGGGGAPLASIALGRGDRDEAERIMNNGFVLLMVFTVVLSVVIYPVMRPLLLLTGASEATLPFAMSYLGVYLTGTVFVMISLGLNSFINCQGRPKVAMLSVAIGAVADTVFDFLFIFVLGWGVSGAALATVLSQAISAAWVLHFLTRETTLLRLRRSQMRLDGRIVRQIFSLGVSPFTMASTESLIGFVLNGSLVVFGDIYVSALTVMQSAMQMVSVPLSGFGQGVSPVISYNYGHRDPGRTREAAMFLRHVSFTWNLVMVLLVMAFPYQVAGVFTTDGSLARTVAEVMPMFVAGMTIFGLQRACQYTFVSTNQARVSLFIALLRKVILLIPLALVLPHFVVPGQNGVFLAEAIADATAALLCTAIFHFRFPKILASISEPVRRD